MIMKRIKSLRYQKIHTMDTASCNNKENRSDCNTAVNAVKRYGFDSIGFELDNGIVGFR